MRVDGTIQEITGDEELAKMKKHTLDLVVDRLVIRDGIRSRMADSVETALREGAGSLIVIEQAPDADEKEHLYSTRLYCAHCEISLPEVKPASFSFNSPLGACPTCDGLGHLMEFDEALVVPDPSLSILDGALAPGAAERTSGISNYCRTCL